MSFEVVESLVRGKANNPIVCEDKLIVTNNFACVVDGATSKSSLEFDGKKQGIIAGEIIERVMNHISPTITITELINCINLEFLQFYEGHNLKEHMEYHPVDRLNASVAIYSDYKKTIWLIGDCQALMNNKLILNTKKIDSLLSELRSFIIESRLSDGDTMENLRQNDIGRKEIIPFLKDQMLFQNSNYESLFSYGVLDGFMIHPQHIKEYIVGNSTSIILASDGYPKLFESLLESEHYLKYILENDPLCYQLFKSTKGMMQNNISFDDRAYIKLSVH